jgi:hypothetical protein
MLLDRQEPRTRHFERSLRLDEKTPGLERLVACFGDFWALLGDVQILEFRL